MNNENKLCFKQVLPNCVTKFMPVDMLR